MESSFTWIKNTLRWIDFFDCLYCTHMNVVKCFKFRHGLYARHGSYSTPIGVEYK